MTNLPCSWAIVTTFPVGSQPTTCGLKYIDFLSVVNAIAVKTFPFAYLVRSRGAKRGAFNTSQGTDPIGRYVSLAVTKVC